MLNRLIDALRGRAVQPAAAPIAPPASSAIALAPLRERLSRGEAAAITGELHALANQHPNNADVLALYGGALFDLAAIEQARQVLAATLRLQPTHAEALNTMGALAAELDHPEEAIGWFEDALEAAPDDLAARYNLSQVLFLAGQYRRGFDLLRARHRLFFGRDNQMEPLPVWQGESIEGKDLFVWCDWGGLGDHLQFVRYLPLIAARYRPRTIRLGAGAEFTRLFGGIEGVTGVATPGHPPYSDLHCPLLDLPYLFGTEVDSVPADLPYLHAAPELVAQAGARLKDAGLATGVLRVGLAWKSNGSAGEVRIYQRMRRTKSLLAELLAPLAVAGAQFVSLQMGSDAQERAATGLAPVDGSVEVRDFADTAAVIANLDLVVSADTSVAHLAAAMGKPVLLLLRRESGLFWLHEREDSPWYPDMRILRQQESGDWAPVVQSARHWLETAVRDGAQAVIPQRPA